MNTNCEKGPAEMVRVYAKEEIRVGRDRCNTGLPIGTLLNLGGY